MKNLKNISLIDSRTFRESDLVIGTEYWTEFHDKSWRCLNIRNKEDLASTIRTYGAFKKVVELVSDRTFKDFNMLPSISVVLPSWYNLTDDCDIYQGGIEQHELEIPIFIYHNDSKLLSMFLMNRTHTIRQLYQVFIGAKCETVNDLTRLLKDFIHERED